MKKFSIIIFSIFMLIFFVSCITTFVAYSECSFTTSPTDYKFSDSNYSWPLPGYHTVSSNFGLRVSPVTGASKYHSGIDIPAPSGTPIYSASSGKVTYLGFNGANGYTIMIADKTHVFTYSHVAPEFIVNVGATVQKNQHIGDVGPKYITPIPSNPYTDSERTPNKRGHNRLSPAF